MQIPRVRFTVRRMMAVVAIFAVLFAVTRRPHPIIGFQFGDLGIVGWSDGSRTIKSGPSPVNFQAVGPVIRVKWSDGSTSWYLTRKFRFLVNAPHLVEHKPLLPNPP